MNDPQPYILSLEKHPSPEDVRTVEEELRAYNRLYAPEDNYQLLALFLRAPDGALIGGLLGETYWGWLHIKSLWVHEEVRRQGLGHRLLTAAEREAVQRGCCCVHVSTLSFQALSFYERHGYRIFGVLDELPIGHSRYFLKKRLLEAPERDPEIPPGITFADLCADHIEEVIALSRRLESDATPCSYWGLDEDKVHQLIRRSDKSTLVAFCEGKIAGLGTLTRGEAYQSHLAELSVAVCPQCRRRGVAKALIRALEKRAREKGIELLKGLVWIKNTPSRKLCESLGYEHRATLYAEFKSATFGEIDDCVYYKALTADLSMPRPVTASTTRAEPSTWQRQG